MNTTTFLRRMATAWPFFGMPASRRTTARSAWPLSMAAAAAGGPPSRTLVCSRMLAAVARELRGDRLHHAGVLAVGRADGDGAARSAASRMIGDRANAAAQQDAGDKISQVCRIMILKRRCQPLGRCARAHRSDRRIGKSEQAAQRNSHGAIISCSGEPAPWLKPGPETNRFGPAMLCPNGRFRFKPRKAQKWLRN